MTIDSHLVPFIYHHYHYHYHYHYHQRCSPLWVLQEQLDILDKMFLTERWESKQTNLVPSLSLSLLVYFPVSVRGNGLGSGGREVSRLSRNEGVSFDSLIGTVKRMQENISNNRYLCICMI